MILNKTLQVIKFHDLDGNGVENKRIRRYLSLFIYDEIDKVLNDKACTFLGILWSI